MIKTVDTDVVLAVVFVSELNHQQLWVDIMTKRKWYYTVHDLNSKLGEEKAEYTLSSPSILWLRL